MLGARIIGCHTGQAHAVIEIGRLAVFGRWQVFGCDVAIAIQPQQIEDRLNESLLNPLAENAATEQQRVVRLNWLVF